MVVSNDLCQLSKSEPLSSYYNHLIKRVILRQNRSSQVALDSFLYKSPTGRQFVSISFLCISDCFSIDMVSMT